MSFLVIGEALIDAVQRPTGATRHPGGSPLNVAVGLARLGREVWLLSRVGDDADGSLITSYLDENKVKLVEGGVSGTTSVAHAVLDDAGAATYNFELNSTYPEPPETEEAAADLLGSLPMHIHVGSIGAHLEPGAHTMRRWLELLSPHATVSYDPNIRMSVMGSADKINQDIAELLPFIDVFKCSDEDLRELAGGKDVDLDEAAHRIMKAGPRLVAITRGKDGLNLYTLTEKAHVNAMDVPVADTVGAGDSLMSALIDALARVSVLGQDRSGIATLSPQVLKSVGEYAVTASAITVTRKGANPPTREEINLSSQLFADLKR